METTKLTKQLFLDHYLDTAIKHYEKFKESNTYDETYKWEILRQLNQYIENKTIDEKTITDIITELKRRNPQSGSFTHWSNIADLESYAESRPSEVATILHNLYRGEAPLKERVEDFFKKGKQFNKDLKLGAPLFGYLLAAFDYKKYPLYKEEAFKTMKKTFGIKKKLGSVSDNYAFYYQVCEILKDYKKDWTMLDIQDFVFSTSSYEEVMVEIGVDYIHHYSKLLKEYSGDEEVFLKAIGNLDRSYLEDRKQVYKDSDKVREIRYQLLEHILEKGSISIEEFEQIKQKVSNKYETNILQSWTNFHILFQIYYDYFKDRVHGELVKIHTYIRSIPEFKEVPFVENDVIKGFGWKQNFGSSECWLAVYPIGFESHRTAAQLFLSIDADSIRYGLLYGSESEKRGEEDLKTITNIETFKTFELRQKLINILPIFLKENGLEPLSKENLAKPFDSIFTSMEEANWAFDFMKEIANELGVQEPGNEKTAVTYRKKRTAIHFNYCSWLISSFMINTDGYLEVGLPLLESETLHYERLYTFAQSNEEEKVNSYVIPANDLKHMPDDLKNNLYNALAVIKKRFVNQTKSQYRIYNIVTLEEAVFNKHKRETLLCTGMDIKGISEPGEEEDLRYFWLTAKPSIWSVDKIKDGSEVFYTAYNEKGNKRRIFTAFEKARPGDKIIFYESTPRKEVVACGEISQGFAKRYLSEYGKEIESVGFRYVEDIQPISWEQLVEVDELQDSNPIKNGAQGSLFEITKDEYETILSLEVPEEETVEVSLNSVNFNIDISLDELYFEDLDIILSQVKLALKSGKHIIFIGPPGTGKSKLAKEICKKFSVDFSMTTATSDWSTYETIGGYRPDRDGTLSFKPGLFLKCFKDVKTNKPLNNWLIIDEMNRADIDKAFGSLFSALTGDPIALTFTAESGNQIMLRPQAGEVLTANDYEYIIPTDWRLIGTMNTFDKASLYEMSYAFMRRFAFIPIGVPKQITHELLQAYLQIWGITHYDYEDTLGQVWKIINNYRQIGPAIVEDIAKYTAENGDFTSALILYVLPQFEGMLQHETLEFVNRVGELQQVNENQLRQFVVDFFQMRDV